MSGVLVVAQLLGAGVPVRALTRRPAAAGLPAAVEVVAGDLTVPESLDAGAAGCRRRFPRLDGPADHRSGCRRTSRDPHAAHRLSLLAAPNAAPVLPAAANPMAVLHADIERRIAAAGLASTIIRPGMFASNARLWWAAVIRDGGVVRWPYGAAETAPIDERDIAAVAARALSEDGHAGSDYVLTGPESLSQAEQVSIIGAAIGRRIHFEELSPEEFRRETAGRWPGPVVDMLLAAWGATIGRPAFMTSTVADVVGSPPRTFRQWVADHADAFLGRPASDEV